MIFDSLAFFVFFPIVVVAFFATPPRFRWVVLLAASCTFYAWWKPQYLILLFISTGVGFLVGRLLEREERPRRRLALLGASLFVNLGMLVFFKYLHFFFPFTRGFFDLALPIGISFYTFQTIGYAIDVYRRQYEAETHVGRFALFVSFFPHLVAGPIMRGRQLLPQFKETQRWDFDRAVSGLGRILWGLFKKVVIADRAAYFVDAVFRDVDHFQGTTLVVATYIFAFQLYCDFSGYSDIALGTARVLGFELMENFDRPFAAPTIMQFWRRWHISFSTWFLDYVYVPLGLSMGRLRTPALAGKKGRAIRTAACVAVIFLLSGLWHGARGTYLLWGAFMGVMMLGSLGVATIWKRSGTKVSAPFGVLGRTVGVIVTFNLVCASLVLFRSDDVAHMRSFIAQLGVDYHVSTFWELTHIGPAPAAANTIDLGILVVSIAAMEAVQWLLANRPASQIPTNVRWLAWSSLCAWVLLAAVQTHSPFIYFAF